jgi:hypothetical protein
LWRPAVHPAHRDKRSTEHFVATFGQLLVAANGQILVAADRIAGVATR